MLPNNKLTREKFLSLFSGPITSETLTFGHEFFQFQQTLGDARQICLDDVINERAYQLAKWGDGDLSRAEIISILGEEFGEACKASIENDLDGYRAEMIQVAAVALRAVQILDRQKARLKEEIQSTERRVGSSTYSAPKDDIDIPNCHHKD